MSTKHYASLSLAIRAVNGDATIETVAQETAGAMVWVTDDQRRKVFLLADATESQPITVAKNLDLVLNNHSLTFTAPGAYLQFAAGTDCRILGAGGSIVKAVGDVGTANVLLVDTFGNSLRVTGGEYLLSCSTGGVAQAVTDLIHQTNPDLEIKTARAEGLRECRKLMTLAKVGKYDGYLLEGMACPGGCVAGAGTLLPVDLATKVVGRYQTETDRTSPLQSAYRDEGHTLD